MATEIMSLTEAFRRYSDAGMKVLPTKESKAPSSPKSWLNGLPESEFNGAYGIGVVCGPMSGGLECFDFDNHFGDADDVMHDYLMNAEAYRIIDKYKLPIEKTVGGGYHLLFRCSENAGNTKLARRANIDGRPEALIETRGNNGYFCAYPTLGYDVIENDIFQINEISPAERRILFEVARSFNEFERPATKTEYEATERPGDLFNSDPSSVGVMKDILIGDGWTEVNEFQWRRPNKTEGISATIGRVAPGVLYVFSSNAYPFDEMRAYTPFQVLALVKFNGDFSAAAASLIPDKPIAHKPQSVTIDQTKADPEVSTERLRAMLDKSRIDPSKPEDPPPTILSIKEVSPNSVTERRLFTLGNFSCIIGKAKSRKTFLISLFAAALANPQSTDKLVSSLPSNKRVVLYFDTEQGRFDFQKVVKRVYKMSGGSKRILAFGLRPYTPKERCEIIQFAFELYGSEVGFCVIDGVADLANAINDEEEATRVSSMLMKITDDYGCHISTIIHQNKNDNFATGHLGSSIMKKAEILISVKKSLEYDELSEVNCDLSRGIDFEPFGISINNDGIPSVVNIEKPSKPKEPWRN